MARVRRGWLAAGVAAILLLVAGITTGLVAFRESGGSVACDTPGERWSELPPADTDTTAPVIFSVLIGECTNFDARAEAVVHEDIVAVSYLGVVAGYDLATGKVLWQHDLDDGRRRAFAPDGTLTKRVPHLYTAPAGLVTVDWLPDMDFIQVHCWDYRTGKELTSFMVDGSKVQHSVVNNNVLVCRNDTGSYWAYDVRSGALLWTRDLESSGVFTFPREVPSSTAYYLPSRSAKSIFRIDMQTGRTLSALQSSASARFTDIITAANGIVVSVDQKGRLLALSTERRPAGMAVSTAERRYRPD